jgi:2-polyprenyl-6-hydroxyphenyl methylase/3-demethylubiquinone-9 3-methyltransferase
VEADAESLPFAEAEFDVVTSAFGAVFAPDQQAVADELVRVCRPGGTIGLTAPTPPAGTAGHVRMMADFLPTMFGAASPLRWGDQEHVAHLFGDRVESLEICRRRSALGTFADEAELRDFLKAHHPVAVALYRDLGDDPDLAAALDDSFLRLINLWYARDDGGSGTFAQEAVIIVARKRRVTPARADDGAAPGAPAA